MSDVTVFIRRVRNAGSREAVVEDEVHVTHLYGDFYVARRVNGDTGRSPKLDFMSLADMLSFCGYVRQDAP